MLLPEPKAKHPREAFREQVIRLIVLIALSFFTCVILLYVKTVPEPASLVWYNLVYVVGISTLITLHFSRVRLASRVMVLGMCLIVFDPTTAYWSPGTVVLSLIFTFIFQIIMFDLRDMLIAVSINMGIYGYFALFAAQPSPLPPTHYFSTPLLALFTTYSAHFIIIGVTLFIRHEQRLKDELMLKQIRSEREALRYKLDKEQEINELKRRMMLRIAHEFRTPLTIIQSSSELLAHYHDQMSPEKRNDKTRKIREQIQQIVAMLDAISEIVNNRHAPQELQVSEFSAEDLITDLTADLPQDQRARVTVTLQDSPTQTLCTDQDVLKVALMAILDNALRFSPADSQVNIIVEEGDKWLLFHIVDRGIGIPTDEQKLIFDPFYRGTNINEMGGLGIGLTLANAAMRALGGTLAVSSTLNEETMVSVAISSIAK